MKHFDHCTREQKIERWEQCLRVLRNLTPHEKRKHFNMKDWGVKTDCGTVACAAGHCGLDPWFRRRGLKLEFVGNDVVDFEWTYDVQGFFGWDGTETIFLDTEPRSVGAVIKEIKAYIRELKSGLEG